MKKLIFSIFAFSFVFGQNDMSVQDIIKAMDDNLNAKSKILTSKMVVHGQIGRAHV